MKNVCLIPSKTEPNTSSLILIFIRQFVKYTIATNHGREIIDTITIIPMSKADSETGATISYLTDKRKRNREDSINKNTSIHKKILFDMN